MRTTTRLCLVISIAAAVGVAAVPVANAAERPGSVNLKGFSSHTTRTTEAEQEDQEGAEKGGQGSRAHRRPQGVELHPEDWNNVSAGARSTRSSPACRRSPTR